MDSFLAGTQVTLTVPLQDRSGNALDVATVDYRVTAQDGSEVVARTNLASFTASAPQAAVVVPAGINVIAPVPAQITWNQIDQFTTREVRTVELFLTLADGNAVMLAKSYALEPADILAVGLNSFMTLPQAELVAMDVPNTTGWAGATEHDKIAALIEARTRICQLRFRLVSTEMGWGQDSLNFIPEGSFITPYANGSWLGAGNLANLTPTQYIALPGRFKSAINKAQLTEADVILAGDSIDAKRQDGLVLDSIGEVRQAFRPGKPLNLPVSRKALRYISLFVNFSKTVGR